MSDCPRDRLRHLFLTPTGAPRRASLPPYIPAVRQPRWDPTMPCFTVGRSACPSWSRTRPRKMGSLPRPSPSTWGNLKHRRPSGSAELECRVFTGTCRCSGAPLRYRRLKFASWVLLWCPKPTETLFDCIRSLCWDLRSRHELLRTLLLRITS